MPELIHELKKNTLKYKYPLKTFIRATFRRCPILRSIAMKDLIFLEALYRM